MTVTLSTNMRQAGEGWCRLRNTHASWKFAYSYMQPGFAYLQFSCVKSGA